MMAVRVIDHCPAGAWLLPDVFADRRLRLVRRTLGVVLLLAAAVTFFQALTM